MKKYFAMVLALIFVLSLAGCNEHHPESHGISSHSSEAYDISSCLIKENNDHYLVLPISKSKVYVFSDQVQYLKNIDINLLKNAEEKISDQVSQYSDRAGYDLQIDDAGYLCLCAEVIVQLDPVKTSDGQYESGGCGIDHEHRFFVERISKNAIKNTDSQQTQNISLLSKENPANISVSSLPEGYNFSFGKGTDAADAIAQYLSGLTLISDYPENPIEYTGMTWVISVEYENGNIDTIYHFGNMFIRANNGPWYKMESQQAARFETLLNELQKNVSCPRPETNLEFWVGENVDNFDFSDYQVKYGLFGGTEYYGRGYQPTYDLDMQQIDPEHCVIYTVTSYPDYSDAEQHITSIYISDPEIEFYGITLNSSFEEFERCAEAQGFRITGSGENYRTARKGNCCIFITAEWIRISVEVTNRNEIIF